MLRLHFTADAPLAIQALLFVPQKNWENLGMGRMETGVNLYCKKVLIQDHAKNLFPDWLRFLRGVVDSEDLPLNISRETMQDSALMQKLNRVLTGRFLKFLDEEAKSEPENYAKFFAEHGHCLKEGVATDYEHRAALFQAAPLRVQLHGERQADFAGGLCGPHARGAEGDLLHPRRKPGSRRGEPLFRGPQGETFRGALPLRSARRVCDGSPAGVRGKTGARRGEGRSGAGAGIHGVERGGSQGARGVCARSARHLGPRQGTGRREELGHETIRGSRGNQGCRCHIGDDGRRAAEAPGNHRIAGRIEHHLILPIVSGRRGSEIPAPQLAGTIQRAFDQERLPALGTGHINPVAAYRNTTGGDCSHGARHIRLPNHTARRIELGQNHMVVVVFGGEKHIAAGIPGNSADEI